MEGKELLEKHRIELDEKSSKLYESGITSIAYASYTDNDVQKYLYSHGFICLTGEADRTGLRILYDLTEEATETLRNFLGVDYMEFPANHNYYEGQVASFMMPRDMILSLFKYMLCTKWGIVIETVPDKNTRYSVDRHFWCFYSTEDWYNFRWLHPQLFRSPAECKDGEPVGTCWNYRTHSGMR